MELKDMKVRDVLELDEFKSQLRQVMDGEEFNQERAASEARHNGARLARTPLDRLKDRGAWDVDSMIDYFANVLNKSLIGFSAGEREYIYLVGMAAFNRTMKKLQDKEKV